MFAHICLLIFNSYKLFSKYGICQLGRLNERCEFKRRRSKIIWLIVKYALAAGIVVLVSEVAKRSDRIGGLLAALPLVTVLILIWMKLEGQAQAKIASHTWYTFWYVVPTLPMFLCSL